MTVLTTLEIGSTITKANAFRMESGLLHHIGQGFAPHLGGRRRRAYRRGCRDRSDA